MLGSALGVLLVSAISVPLLGIFTTAIILGGLNALMAISLFLYRKKTNFIAQ